MAHRGEPRSALVHVPDRPPSASASGSALVLAFHGRGGTPLYIRAVTGLAEKADACGFIAVFPEADRQHPDRSVHVTRNPTLWNDGSSRTLRGRPPRDDVGFIDALLDHLSARLSIDERRVFATGFSNGGSMAMRLAVELSGRIAAIAPVASNLWLRERGPARPMSMIYVTGDSDPLNPLEGGEYRTPWGEIESKPPVRETLDLWARWIGCAPGVEVQPEREGVRRERRGPGAGGAEVLSFVLAGVGHVWPGGRSVLTGHAPPPHDFRATDAIWEFFERHPLAPAR